MTTSTGLAPALEYHVVNSLGWADLRPLQRAAVGPVRSGADTLLLAPTAGGKTEAAAFPLLSGMVERDWRGLSVLYVTPLRALLNDLEPRLSRYAAWVGRRVGLWHGDIGAGPRRRLLADPPDVLLTTPESVEAMLVSANVDHRALFGSVRAVVVDELHAFARDDRGWHLLAVLERVQRLAGRRVQRVGLTATVGNPEQLLAWLGGAVAAPVSEVVAPPLPGPGAAAAVDVTLDYVGSVANAAAVIAALHAGEKRLVFCDSRAQAEALALELRARDVTTFVSHSSLSAAERRRSEQAFAEARDCVVVATSTLELGVDVGDLDRVVQIDAPATVASFLQRLGRTGRRPGTSRNTLCLATRDDTFLQAAGLLRLWRQGFVEPVTPPPTPTHIAAQQLLAIVLQEGAVGRNGWSAWWGDLVVMRDAEDVLAHLLGTGFLDLDGDLMIVGQEAERRFGRRHFRDLTAVFTADPELAVLHGRSQVGSVSPLSLATATGRGQPRVLALAGRAWRVTHVDWRRHTVHVVPDEGRGRSRWHGAGPGLGRQLAQSMRAVLLGDHQDVPLSKRGAATLTRLRQERADQVWTDGTVLAVAESASRWWTWAGTATNTSLAAALTSQGHRASNDALAITIDGPIDAREIRAHAATGVAAGALPQLDQAALDGLKFSAALPVEMAVAVLARRLGDPHGAADVCAAAVRVSRG